MDYSTRITSTQDTTKQDRNTLLFLLWILFSITRIKSMQWYQRIYTEKSKYTSRQRNYDNELLRSLIILQIDYFALHLATNNSLRKKNKKQKDDYKLNQFLRKEYFTLNYLAAHGLNQSLPNVQPPEAPLINALYPWSDATGTTWRMRWSEMDLDLDRDWDL